MLEHGFKPLSYATIRYFAATALFWGFTYSRERSFRIALSDCKLVVLAGSLIFINQIGFVYGLQVERVDGRADPRHDADLHRDLVTALRLRAARPAVLGRGACSFVGVGFVAAGERRRARAESAAICSRIFTARRGRGTRSTIAPLMRRYSPFRISAIVLAIGWVPLALVGRPADRLTGLSTSAGGRGSASATRSSGRSS